MRIAALAFLFALSPALAQMPAPITAGPEHALLQRMAGTWQVEMTMVQPDGKTEKSTGTMTSTVVMGGLGLTSDMEAPMGPGKMLGHAFATWIPGKGQFQSIWMDNMSHQGMSQGWGTWDPAAQTLTETITGPGPDGTPMTFVSVTKIESPDRHSATFTMKGPDGKEIPMMTMVYTRKKG